MARKRTIYLPDELATRVDEYLQGHRSLTFSSLVQQALERHIFPPDVSAILKLAGFVESRPCDAADDDRFTDRPEDHVILHER